ncbi:hypothetical protein K435DRAFT_930371 [Dendrothele bispora CBS 962.96]|uniref:FAD/NAD(P)-binding domain-containing protein n=1 Tax=Dendrothele bispora (strain CBS 962.96) TaxID=1314807 RepID=A0A4V4HH15_DENBC|nr:hypothetical protein K435DRAFT_930371 [Dendrothele bispora CBS 962.96]
MSGCTAARRFNGQRSVCVIGSGAAAHTLIKDGFTDVTVLLKDGASGGVWEHTKVYSGELTKLSVYGDYRFSCLEMPRHPER